MDVTINREENKFNVVLNGRLDTTNVEQFQKDIAVLMESGKSDIVFDCTGMEYTSSQGLRMFLMMQKYVNQQGGSMKMINMRPQVKEVFDITGFSSIISIS